MKLSPGIRFKSAVCSFEGVVVKAPTEGENIVCGAEPVLGLDEPIPEVAKLTSAEEGSAFIGKRYVDEVSGLEVLCTKPGFGRLSFEGRPLLLKQPKPLPSSD